jgi:hypothetical protein
MFSVEAINSTWVMGLASVAGLLVFGLHATSLRMRGLRARPWPYVAIGVAFVVVFVVVFWPAIGVWFASRGGAQ